MKINPRDLTIEEAVFQIRSGQVTSRELVESCLDRIAQRESLVQAWVEVYEKEALETADEYDAYLKNGTWMGDLHGIPIGIKDIIDVKGMWLRAGCEAYPAAVSEQDAVVIQKLRAAGAITLGKTRTTAFANNDPTVTRNPWNLEHTPGGSSSGSGAAVADRMCLAAIGSQTGGSLIRPASYNGVVGLKPTYGNFSLQGVIPVSWNLDHIGTHSRSVADAARLFRVLREEHPEPFAKMPPLPAGTMPAASFADRAPRLGFLKEFREAETSADMLDHLRSTRHKFEEAGARVVDLDLPQSFDEVSQAHGIIFEVDLACYHRRYYPDQANRYPPKIRARIENGLGIPGHLYADALLARKRFQDDMGRLLSSVDAAVMPSSLSTAPLGLASTGSAAANVPWSFSGFPAISLPSGIDSQGLPFGTQFVSLPWCDELLISAANWCEQVLCFKGEPKTSD